MYALPENVSPSIEGQQVPLLKQVLLWNQNRWNGDKEWGTNLPSGREMFQQCPVSTCTLSLDRCLTIID